MADYTKFRFGDLTLAQLDALAASAGDRSQAAREAVAYWHRAVSEAGRLNANELPEEDWVRLAHLNQPDPLPYHAYEEDRTRALDWSTRLATELVGMWEGRATVLPEHKAEARACRSLAKQIASWGLVRGYALYSCLRHFWAREDTPKAWWEPEVWMTPRPRETNGEE